MRVAQLILQDDLAKQRIRHAYEPPKIFNNPLSALHSPSGGDVAHVDPPPSKPQRRPRPPRQARDHST
eukprot:scaffold735_cov255-Pinguiococcus_pyrenoidosus.AAC.34